MKKKQGLKLEAQTFTTSDVIGLTGIASETLQNWVKRGYAMASIKEGQGKGSVRLWKFVDVEAIAIALELVKASISPGDALDVGTLISAKTWREVVDILGHEPPDWEHLDKPMPKEATSAVAILRFERSEFDNERISIVTAGRPNQPDIFSDPRIGMIIPIGAIKSRLRERWADIEATRTRKRRTT
jgi:hypothetical protein